MNKTGFWRRARIQGALAMLAMAAILVGVLLSLAPLATLAHAHFGFRIGIGLRAQLVASLGLILAGVSCLLTRSFLSPLSGNHGAAQDKADSNRLLGLAFHGQGQLDQAFEKFCLCPLNQGLMENLYNLALDYERQRDFGKAEAVFRHMANHDIGYRDLAQRLARIKHRAEAAILSVSKSEAAAEQGLVNQPKLGRYTLEKELGKGAMGLVYQGRDAETNRLVAIKTLALSQEFDSDALADVKARFFREVETAGRLSHPNIISMYEAGEDRDLAYIAMEFVQGGDLIHFTRGDNLLPTVKVLSIIARVAKALDFAHRNNVIHRDIKPGNILYEPLSDQVKVTDFGIARITDSNRTRTGMVLGTPSYMAPEQLLGRKVDGRADLFSLGVTLYQLCCGRLPFVGKSMGELMAKITKEPPADILANDALLPPSLVAVILKALNKNPAERYQRGEEMAADLKKCAKELEDIAAAGASIQP